jgi:hypothetical protein
MRRAEKIRPFPAFPAGNLARTPEKGYNSMNI